jgi:hypothetical protein
MSLRAVLQKCDLVKFAKSMPEYRIANDDRKVVETCSNETKKHFQSQPKKSFVNKLLIKNTSRKNEEKKSGFGDFLALES